MTNKEIWLYLKSKSGGGESTNAFTVFNATVTNSKITINSLIDKTTVGDIEIPSKIESASVTVIDAYAFENCSSLTSITIPDSVTAIRYNAFENCSSLTSITIPDSVTSIGAGVFVNCFSLTSITMPNSVTSIGRSAFRNCTNLTSVEIPNSVTSIESDAFYNCSSLTYIEMPNSVTSISNNAFNNCGNLTDVTLKDNFNCNNLNLSSSNKYSKETIVAMLNALADRTEETAYTLTLGTTNLAKMNDEEIAIATTKNWTLA